MNYIDLFAGAGGLSEGFIRAGFNPIAHVEMDKNACDTLRTRLAYHFLKDNCQQELYLQYLKKEISREELYKSVPNCLLDSVINKEVSEESLMFIFDKIDSIHNSSKVDLIVGGPPCQAYSVIGRARIGKENVLRDKRYKLYELYSKFVERYQPEYFVFENVTGILTAESGELFKRIKEYFREKCGYSIDYRLVDSSKYGVLQTRRRVIIIGKKGVDGFNYPVPEESFFGELFSIKKSLFSDLPTIKSGQRKPAICTYFNEPLDDYLFESGIRDEAVDFVSQHITRPHTKNDLRIYRIAINKWIGRRERLKYKDLPEYLITHKNIEIFEDKFKVIDPFGICHTVVAHLHKDGHHFIYPDPDNPRSVSIREAARIQSFPDNYFFEGGQTAAFTQIGNAVPPLLAYKIAARMKEVFDSLSLPIDELYAYSDPVG